MNFLGSAPQKRFHIIINNNSSYHFQLDGEYFSWGGLSKQDLSTGSVSADVVLNKTASSSSSSSSSSSWSTSSSSWVVSKEDARKSKSDAHKKKHANLDRVLSLAQHGRLVIQDRSSQFSAL